MSHLLFFQIFPLLFLFLLFTWSERLLFIQRYGIALVFIFGFSLQFIFWYLSHPNLENPDSMGFYRLAHGLETDLRNIFFRPKLYPLFLGLFPTLKSVTLIQVGLKVGMGFFILRIGKLFNWKLGSLLFILSLFFMNSFWLQEPLRIMDTTLFTFLFSAVIWLTMECVFQLSSQKFYALCICMGLATLTRQVGDPSFFVMTCGLILVLFQKQRLAQSRIVNLKLFVPILVGLSIGFSGLLWNGINYGLYHRTIAVGNVLYTHSSYYQLANGMDEEWKFVNDYLPDSQKELGIWKTSYRSDIPWPVNAMPHNLERALLHQNGQSLVEMDAILKQHFFAWVMANPKDYLASIGNESMRLLWKSEEYYPESVLKKVMNRFSLKAPLFMVRGERGLIHLSIGFLLGLAIFGLFLDRTRRVYLLLPLFGVAVYLLLIPSIILGFTRYGFPVLPILLALFGNTCDQIRTRLVLKSV